MILSGQNERTTGELEMKQLGPALPTPPKNGVFVDYNAGIRMSVLEMAREERKRKHEPQPSPEEIALIRQIQGESGMVFIPIR
jgi:hypothetical protein